MVFFLSPSPVRNACSPGGLTADQGSEGAAKASAAHAVNDEVERRVGHDQKIADAYVEEQRDRADRLEGQVKKDDRQSLSDESWALAGHEDNNNDDQHACDLVLYGATLPRSVTVTAIITASRRPPRLASPTSATKRRHQLVVEYDERAQWHEEHDDAVHQR